MFRESGLVPADRCGGREGSAGGAGRNNSLACLPLPACRPARSECLSCRPARVLASLPRATRPPSSTSAACGHSGCATLPLDIALVLTNICVRREDTTWRRAPGKGSTRSLGVPPGDAQPEATTSAESGRTCGSHSRAAVGISTRPELDWQRYWAGWPPESPWRACPAEGRTPAAQSRTRKLAREQERSWIHGNEY